ncbi:MAG: hypothetical protein ABI639_10920 [Thermoanaerobaculia bacterium]
MKRNRRLAIVFALLLSGAVFPLPAQEERTLFDLIKASKAQLEEMEHLLQQQRVRVNRLLVMTRILVRDNEGLRPDGPATARGRVQQAIDKAREFASAESPLGEEVFAVLDQCQAEFDRNVIGESQEAFAARFSAAVRPLGEQALGELHRNYVEALALQELGEKADDLSTKSLSDTARQSLELATSRSDLRPGG